MPIDDPLRARDDATGRQLRAWDPQANNQVLALAAASGRIYVGGYFTRIASAARLRLAAFDAASAALTPWNPGPRGSEPGLPITEPGVTALVATGGTLDPPGQRAAGAGIDGAH